MKKSVEPIFAISDKKEILKPQPIERSQFSKILQEKKRRVRKYEYRR